MPSIHWLSPRSRRCVCGFGGIAPERTSRSRCVRSRRRSRCGFVVLGDALLGVLEGGYALTQVGDLAVGVGDALAQVGDLAAATHSTAPRPPQSPATRPRCSCPQVLRSTRRLRLPSPSNPGPFHCCFPLPRALPAPPPVRHVEFRVEFRVVRRGAGPRVMLGSQRLIAGGLISTIRVQPPQQPSHHGSEQEPQQPSPMPSGRKAPRPYHRRETTPGRERRRLSV